MCMMKNQTAEHEFPPCPVCKASTKYNMKKWPPKVQGKEEIVYYICEKGHEFDYKRKLT